MSVRSENQRLRRVIVHQPGRALELLRPRNVREGNSEYLLMDDLLFVRHAQEEHRIFCDVLRTVAEVIDVTSLLEDLLNYPTGRKLVLKAMQVPEAAQDLPAKLLGEVILSGYWQGEFYSLPCPNLIFTRDVAAVMGDTIILSSAAAFNGLDTISPRAREMELMHLILRHHPMFLDYDLVPSDPAFSREGGDFFALTDKIAAIGISQRTKAEAIKAVAPAIFRQGFERILMVHLITERSYMHLDTVFSMPSPNECLIYEEVLNGSDTFVSKIESTDPEMETVLNGSFVNVLEEQLQIKLNTYFCGGGDPILAEREQWTDGSNLLALAPGLVVGYDRNEATANHLAEKGYRLLTPAEYLADPRPYLEDGVKGLILIPSAELSRGRGGPRCLTLPIARD